MNCMEQIHFNGNVKTIDRELRYKYHSNKSNYEIVKRHKLID